MRRFVSEGMGWEGVEGEVGMGTIIGLCSLNRRGAFCPSLNDGYHDWNPFFEFIMR